MATDFQIRLAAHHLRMGHIVAYPTEGVWGLGCDPFNPKAVQQLLRLKQRNPHKGLILVASDYSMLSGLFAELSDIQISQLQSTWPGPTTWLVPIKSHRVPVEICGNHATIAVRISAHPLVSALSTAFKGPITSTSANVSGQAALLSLQAVRRAFGDEIAYYLPGELTNPGRTSTIRDLTTQTIIRP